MFTPRRADGGTRSGLLFQDTVSRSQASLSPKLTQYPEIIGHAVKVGSKVTTVKVGDRVGVGAQIYACLECNACKEDNETYCKKLLGSATKLPVIEIFANCLLRHLRFGLPRRYHRPWRLLLSYPSPRALHIPYPRGSTNGTRRTDVVCWIDGVFASCAQRSRSRQEGRHPWNVSAEVT